MPNLAKLLSYTDRDSQLVLHYKIGKEKKKKKRKFFFFSFIIFYFHIFMIVSKLKVLYFLFVKYFVFMVFIFE